MITELFDQLSLDTLIMSSVQQLSVPSQKRLICFTVSDKLIVRVVLFTLHTLLLIILTVVIIKR